MKWREQCWSVFPPLQAPRLIFHWPIRSLQRTYDAKMDQLETVLHWPQQFAEKRKLFPYREVFQWHLQCPVYCPSRTGVYWSTVLVFESIGRFQLLSIPRCNTVNNRALIKGGPHSLIKRFANSRSAMSLFD